MLNFDTLDRSEVYIVRYVGVIHCPTHFSHDHTYEMRYDPDCIDYNDSSGWRIRSTDGDHTTYVANFEAMNYCVVTEEDQC